MLGAPSRGLIEREGVESDNVLWTEQPPAGTCVHFDVVYTPAGMPVTGHPGARSMGTRLVGHVELANGERVFVTSVVREIGADLRAEIQRLRSAPIAGLEAGTEDRTGIVGFGTEPNPDANDGTFVGTTIDLTRQPSG